VPNGRHASSVYVAAGGRVGLEVPLWPKLSLGVHADALTPLTSTTLGLGPSADVWTTPPLSVALGVRLVAHF
jgi:hypothetical protein